MFFINIKGHKVTFVTLLDKLFSAILLKAHKKY